MITIYGNYFDPNADSVEVLVGGKLQATIPNFVHTYLLTYIMCVHTHTYTMMIS